MDWGRDCELLKSGGLPSFNRRNEEDELEDPFGEHIATGVAPRVDDQEEESQGNCHLNSLQDIG